MYHVFYFVQCDRLNLCTIRLNNEFYINLLFQVAQRLYPQCQSCFSLQGGAVRSNIHHLIYHYKLQIYHFAPFFIHYLSSNGSFIEFLENCVKYIEEHK